VRGLAQGLQKYAEEEKQIYTLEDRFCRFDKWEPVDKEWDGSKGIFTCKQIVEKEGKNVIETIPVPIMEKGETLGNCNTLPSHYTLTHFVEGVSPDVYYHPAKTLLEIFDPGLDEWGSAVSLYLNQGDVILHPSYLEFSTPPVEHKRVTLSMMIQLQPK